MGAQIDHPETIMRRNPEIFPLAGVMQLNRFRILPICFPTCMSLNIIQLLVSNFKIISFAAIVRAGGNVSFWHIGDIDPR